jgi:3-oxoacyl-[acyl-carrier protein] reductase
MKTAVVTGAGQGLGRAVAVRLAEDGYRIIAVDLDEGRAEETAAAVGGLSATCDVGNGEDIFALADQVGPVDVLVNNAGIWRYGPILEASTADLDDVLRVNVMGTVNCCRAFVPAMTQLGGGAIVNLSSAAASTGAAGVEIYPATKGAVEVLTRQLSGELGPLGIRVNAVAPGLIVTEGTVASYGSGRSDQRSKAVPLRRVGAPTDIASVVSFLVSDDASYVSGQVIAVDGGLTASRPNA